MTRVLVRSWLRFPHLGLLLVLAACGGSSSAVAPAITGPATPLPSGTTGVPYAATFTASGTTPTWSISVGSLPPGLTLTAATGALSGTPTQTGGFSFTVLATNGAGSDARAYTLAVHGPAAVSEVEANDTTGTANAITLGTPGQGTLVAVGDVDVWALPLTAGQDIEIELHARRADQAAWVAAPNNLSAALLHPDGVTQLVRATGSATRDGDVALFRVTVTGTHFLTLATSVPGSPGGRYAFTVKARNLGTVQSEVEPNDTAATANPITPGVVFGHHAAGEFDFFSFAVTAPAIVRFEMVAFRNGIFGASPSAYDPIIDLKDATGATTFRNNDDAINLDSALTFQLNVPGTYALQVRHFSATPFGDYFLFFESLPVATITETEPNQPAPASSTTIGHGTILTGSVVVGDDDFFVFPGNAGDMVYLQLLASSLDVQGSTTASPSSSLVAADGTTVVPSASEAGLRFRRAILTTTGAFFARLTTASATPLPYTLRMFVQQSSAFETEPNDAPASANAIPNGGKVSGVVATAGDGDVFAFQAVAGELVVFSLQGNSSDAVGAGLDGWGSTIEPELTVLDGASTVLATATAAGARGSVSGLMRRELAFIAPATGTFFVQVADLTPTATDFYTLIKR